MSTNQIVSVITGASSGFGALTARALADQGNIVYAGMRETAGRNAHQVAAADASLVSDEIARIVALPVGQRPYRVHIDPAGDGSEEVSQVADRIRTEFLTSNSPASRTGAWWRSTSESTRRPRPVSLSRRSWRASASGSAA